MCCDFSPSPNSEITARLAALRAAKPALERRMANELLDFYRRRRRLPVSPAPMLVDQLVRARIVTRGEIEHALGIAGLVRRLHALGRRLRRRWRGR